MNDASTSHAERPRRQRLLVVGALASMSGLWALLSESWSLPYQGNLFFHPAISLWWTAAAFLSATRGERRRGWSRARLASFGAVVLALALPALLRAYPTAALAAGAILAMAFAPGARQFDGATFAQRALSWLVSRLFVLAGYSGIEIFAMGLGRAARAAFWLHRVSSLAFLAAVAAAAIAALASPERTAPVKALVRRVWPAALFTGLLAIAIAVDAGLRNPSFDLHLSTLPNAAREPFERIQPFTLERPELLDQIESCGKPGSCHPAALADHLPSAHNRSLMTPHFQQNLEFMVTEIGPENANLCAGCHHPQSLFDARLSFRDFAKKDNFSCVHCHVVDAVSFPEDRRRSVMRMTPNLRHLALLAPQADGRSSPFARFAVLLYPEGHARTLRNDLLFSDDFCQACHRLQIKPTKETGFARSRCIDCHMQPSADVGLKTNSRMNHRFPGSNTAVPYANGDMEQTEFTRRFMAGDFPLRIEAWGQVSALDGDTAIRHWLEMHFEPRSAPAPGQPFKFVIWTANWGVDHAFPAAPLDLIEVWLELRLTDAAGRVLLSSGQLDAADRIPLEARRMGGYMIGNDGEVVTKNRVWQIAKKIVVRQLEFGQRTSDEFETTLPADVKGPLTLTASWNYRNLNQEFVEWAIGPGVTMPVSRVGSLRWEISLTEPLIPLPAAAETPGAASGPREVPSVHP